MTKAVFGVSFSNSPDLVFKVTSLWILFVYIINLHGRKPKRGKIELKVSKITLEQHPGIQIPTHVNIETFPNLRSSHQKKKLGKLGLHDQKIQPIDKRIFSMNLTF